MTYTIVYPAHLLGIGPEMNTEVLQLIQLVREMAASRGATYLRYYYKNGDAVFETDSKSFTEEFIQINSLII